MAFRKPKNQPEFADLIGILAQSKDTDNALYQTTQELINRLTQFKVVTTEQLADINNSVNNSITIINLKADKKASYLTDKDESLNFPNSRQLLAGTGITFDDSVPNKRTIKSTGGSGGDHYDCPLTDGDPIEAELIFADGECVIVQVPV